MIKAVFFDMDGTLIDSEPEYFEMNKNYLQENGINPSLEQLYEMIGITMDKTYQMMFSFFEKGTKEMEQFRQEYDQYCQDHAFKVKDILKENVKEVLEYLKNNEIKIYLASSSPMSYIDTTLDECEIRGYFAGVVSGEQFSNPKPAGDIYEACQKMAQVEKDECLVIEDSTLGIQAGKNAGMKVCAIKAFGNQDQSKADYHIDNLIEALTIIDPSASRVLHLDYQGKELVLIPTAHVSKNSALLTRAIIEKEKPDSICIELDSDRYKSMTEKKKWEDTDLIKIIKENRVGYFLVSLILSSYQKRMATSLDTNSGGEMLEGINQSKKRNVPLVLADRSVQTTFTRIWRKMGFGEKFKLLTGLVSSIFEDEEMSEEDIRKLSDKDELTGALNEISEKFPIVSETLVTERDKYLAAKIKEAPGKKIVAILGAAHLIGIEKLINEQYDVEELDQLPPKGKLGKIIFYGLSITLLSLIVLTFTKNTDMGFSQLLSWILWHGVLSSIGAAICLAHPLSILTAFIASPISALSPLLAAGWFAGLVEVKLRKPTVKDFENLPTDINTFKGFITNKVTKILLVVVLANVGSSLASIISSVDIVKKFAEVFGL